MNLDDVGKINYGDIKPTNRKFQNYNHILCDTETVKGKPECIQFYTPNEDQHVDLMYVTGSTITDIFCDYISDHWKKNTVVWFFYMPFDMPITFFPHKKLFCYDDHEMRYGDDFYFRHVAGKTWFSDCSYKKKRFFIRDAFQFLFRSLDQSCKDLKLPQQKLTRPSFLGERSWKTKKEQKIFEDYSKADTVALWGIVQWIMAIHDEYDCSLSVSLADLCGKIFRKHYSYGRRVKALDSTDCIASLLSYHGGKSQCYIEAPALVKNIHEFDISSAYPYAMSHLPNFFDYKIHHDKKPKEIKTGVYKVSGVLSCPYVGLFTHDYQAEKTLEQTWVTSYELNEVLKHKEFEGVIHEGYWVDSATEYQDKPNGLQEYVKDFYKLKSEATNPTQRLWAKLALNSLYGKFIARIIDSPEGQAEKWRGGSLFHPMIATLITGFVRAYCHQIEHSGKAIHTSTDSFVTKDPELGSRFPGLENGLGKLEYNHSGDILILRRKLYIILDENQTPLKYALHGFQGKIDDIMRMWKERSNTYEIKRMVRLRESYKLKDPTIIPFMFRTQKRRLNINWCDYKIIGE